MNKFTKEGNDDSNEGQVNEEIKLDRETRNYFRRVLLKNLKKLLILKKVLEENIEKSEIMAKQAKIDDICIPVFDRANFSSLKFRIMNILEYKECNNPATRQKLETEKPEDWKKADLKAKTILISTVSDKQLEYLSDCKTTLEMMQKLEKMYLTKSTALQIIKRNKLEQVKLRNYGTIEEFLVEFAKACNELKLQKVV